jgi:hypothetical protein
MRLLMTWLTADSTNEVEMDLVGAVALPVVGYGRGVRGEVASELADRLGQLARLDACIGVGKVGGEVVDGLPGTEDVAVPEKPLHPLQLGSDVGPVWGAQRGPLARGVSTVIRIVRWNQSSRCSACGLRQAGQVGRCRRRRR